MTYEEAKKRIDRWCANECDYGYGHCEECALKLAIEALELVDKDGCVGCKYVEISPNEYPCKDCKMSKPDLWSPKR